MKYGDTLQQRSIPLWESYNIDYNDIKHLIKVRTTQGQGQAIAVPNAHNEAKALHAFERELFQELKDQHTRIDLFVRSKSGEIARRLSHLDRQISQLSLKTFKDPQGKISVRRLEKFSKAEEALLRTGEEIQSLSRFVGAQRLAFQKLLKKYKKWTSSPELGNRFHLEILDRPYSFSKRDFEPLLTQWSEALTAVRAPFVEGIQWHSGHQRRKESATKATRDQNQDSSSAANIHSAWEIGSNVDIDTVLATQPLGRGATKATFWVHPDDIVQVHILLLQYTRLRTSIGSTHLNVSKASPRSSRQESLTSGSGQPVMRTDDEICCVVCDDLQRFARQRSGEPVSASEDIRGSLAEKALMSVRHSTSSDAVIAINTSVENGPRSNSSTPLKTTKIKRKALRYLFEQSNHDVNPKALVSDQLHQIWDWLSKHQAVQPLVKMEAKRSRFFGLHNTENGGIWATLDKDISMSKCSREQILISDELDSTYGDRSKSREAFPHAILNVRTEGATSTELIAVLDSSHLTERVRGFSLETHAVAVLCTPCGMPRPFWLPALKQDIRKVPTTKKATSARGPVEDFRSHQSSTPKTSTSASSSTQRPESSSFSIRVGESSATSAPEIPSSSPISGRKGKRRHSQPKRSLRDNTAVVSRKQRYWNEFDDGSEASETEAYTVYVDPNDSSLFPGAKRISNVFASFAAKVEAFESRLGDRLKPAGNVTKDRKPLLSEAYSPTADDSDLSNDETIHAYRPNYSTMARSHGRPATRDREKLLFRCCLTSFAASFVLLIVATTLETTARRKSVMAVDAGVIFAVAASLVFGIIGVGTLVGRRDSVGWTYRIIVLILFLCIVMCSGGVLVALGSL